MNRQKIDYGIDLGTTNSSICRMEKGNPVLMRTDTLREVMPSCVSFTRRQNIKVGDAAFNDLKQEKLRATHSWSANASNTFQEFKRTMGTDTRYHSNNMQRDYSSVELSAEVLKALKGFVADEQPRSVVITVPAKFTVNQKTATLEAGKQAGFEQCELLQEPIAAAMAYGLSAKEKDGCWMVFDFGGGTFDAALLKIEDGIIQVTDTEGDNYLGGKNLDYAIVDRILLPYMGRNFAINATLADDKKREVLREALKTYAEELKIGVSTKTQYDLLSNLGDLGNDDDGQELELDLVVSQEQAFEVMRPLVQKAIDLCRELLVRNDLQPSQLNKIILVGGPTRLPLIRQMLTEQVAPVVDTSADPMTVVAKGAALYASTRDAVTAETSDSCLTETVRLEVGYEATTVELNDWVSLKIAPDEKRKSVMAELLRNDKAWSSGRVEIDKQGQVVAVQLKQGCPNSFAINLTDSQGNALPCSPSEFVIIQGTKIGSAVLPYHIGISVWDGQKADGVFMPLMGLEKNKRLPARGVIRNRRTTSQLRPGVDTDCVKIPVYQADEYNEKSRAYLYEWVADVEITGDEVPSFIPQGSLVEVTLHVDVSEQMTLEVYFPEFDVTVEKHLDTGRQQSVSEAATRIAKDIASAYGSLYVMKSNGIDIAALQNELAEVEEDNRVNNEKKAVLQHLKAVLRKIESLEGVSEWNAIERQLERAMSHLKTNQENIGNSQTELRVRELEVQAEDVERRKDIKTAKILIGMVKKFDERLDYFRSLVGFVMRRNLMFDSYKWVNANKARKMVDNAVNAIEGGDVSIEQLDNYTDIIWSMEVHEPVIPSLESISTTINSASSNSTTSNKASSDETIDEEKRKRLLT